MTKFTINIWTDGSCRGNPGPAGCGVILEYKDSRREISKSIGLATNNIAEISAVVLGFEALHHPERCDVTLHTDSQLVEGLLIRGWKAKKNTELVKLMRSLAEKPNSLNVVKISAHNGNPNNERCDELAKLATERA